MRRVKEEVTLKTKLPEPLESYFEAVNREDVEAMLVPFTANAVVRDEGKTRSGVPELRVRIDDVTEIHHPRYKVENVSPEVEDADTVLGQESGRVTGVPS